MSWDTNTNTNHRKEGYHIYYYYLFSPPLSSHLYISHHYIIGGVVSPSEMLKLVRCSGIPQPPPAIVRIEKRKDVLGQADPKMRIV